jgi:dihydrolipoamide dehydrogenase
MIGRHATDLIGEAVTLMTMEAAVEDLAEAIKPHPTLSETLREAALDWGGILIHKLKK